ncbi:ankyrin-1-like [Haliotis asinina]|uniref:ankyrin-1-like n=1 Tax=Haliotis asinina TaxID=109174 RepID=UPI003531FDC6
MTPVLLAAYHGKKEVFDILVKTGADLSVTDEDGDNILHVACRGGNAKIVNYILMQNIVHINSKGDGGMTPVLIAAFHGKKEAFDILVKRGADLSVTDVGGDNILHVASRGGNAKIVNYILMQNIVHINSKGDGGMTPVLIAAFHGKKEAFDILVKRGADLSVTDEDGDNILHCACGGRNVKIVNYILMQNIVDINEENDGVVTPVMLAAGTGEREIFDILVKRGADLSVTNANNRNILHWACVGGNDKLVNFILMQNNVDINGRNIKGMTPVMLAAYYGKREVFDILVRKRVHLSEVGNDGKNILHLVCEGKNVEIVKHILRLHIVDINCRFNEMTPLMLAVKYHTRNVLQLLLESGADPSLVNRDGDNVLHLACMRGDEEIVKHVLKLHTLNINCRGSKGRTPLLLAAEYKKYDVFELLLEGGADPSAVNGNGDNILHMACEGDSEEILKHVLKLHTLDINCRGYKGRTPLLVAAVYSAYDVFKLLLESGGNLSVVDSDGNSILHFASMGEDEKIVKHILKLHVVDINCRGSKGMTPLLLAARQALPQSRRDVDLQGQWTETQDGRPFLLFSDGDDDKMIAFSTEEQLATLQSADTIYMDGTFSSCPALWSQLYIIHARNGSTMYPLVFVLMPDRQQTTYARLLRLLKDKVQELHNRPLQPTRVQTDFELAAIRAIEREFPQAEVKGCFFHYCQAVWRKTQDLGLAVLYKDNPDVQRWIRRAAGLPLLPVGDVQDTWLDAMNDTPAVPRADDMHDYIVETWVDYEARFPLISGTIIRLLDRGPITT